MSVLGLIRRDQSRSKKGSGESCKVGMIDLFRWYNGCPPSIKMGIIYLQRACLFFHDFQVCLRTQRRFVCLVLTVLLSSCSFSREAKTACLWDIRTGDVVQRYDQYSPGVPITRDLFTHGFDPTGRFYALGGVRFLVIYSLRVRPNFTSSSRLINSSSI